MKRLSISFIVILALGFMISCQKDPNTNTKDQISFGNTQGMRIITADSTVYLSATQYSIDLDQDGTPDLKLANGEAGSPGMGYVNLAKLQCLTGKVSLLGAIIEPVMYLHEETTIRYFHAPDYPQFDSICEIVHLYDELCEPMSDSDQVITQSERFAFYNNEIGDQFTKDDYFENTDVALKGGIYTYGDSYGYGTDTIHIYVHQLEDACDRLQFEKETYIGFKLDNNGKSKLGWLKVIAKNSSDRVILLETAIQK